MDVYIKDGALFCADCAPRGADGAHADGGGEADCPQHCDGCEAHLDNPLTHEGRAYVASRLRAWRTERYPTGRLEILAVWADAYQDVLYGYDVGFGEDDE